jgi:hypothetical protein
MRISTHGYHHRSRTDRLIEAKKSHVKGTHDNQVAQLQVTSNGSGFACNTLHQTTVSSENCGDIIMTCSEFSELGNTNHTCSC